MIVARMIGSDCFPVCRMTERFIPKPSKITAYCRIFLDTNVMPLCRADLSLTNNVMTIPRRIAKTGPPTIGKIFPKIQLGIAITRHNSTPFQFFLIKFIFITSLKIF